MIFTVPRRHQLWVSHTPSTGEGARDGEVINGTESTGEEGGICESSRVWGNFEGSCPRYPWYPESISRESINSVMLYFTGGSLNTARDIGIPVFAPDSVMALQLYASGLDILYRTEYITDRDAPAIHFLGTVYTPKAVRRSVHQAHCRGENTL